MHPGTECRPARAGGNVRDMTTPPLPDSVTLAEGEGGLPVLRVAAASATGEIYLNGGHVTAWTPAGHDPVLWMSGSSNFTEGQAIRGGIPICFPWFGPAPEPGLPAHGFARLAQWRLREVQEDDGAVTVALELTDADVTALPAAASWPHAFTATLTVTIGTELTVALEVHNTGRDELSYEAALHSYLAVSDVRAATVQGLDGAGYLDKAPSAPAARAVQDGDVTFTGETDRVYDSTATAVVLDQGRSIGISKDGSAHTVVWNPWVDKAAAMADFGDAEWPATVCVETANVLDAAIALAPGQRHVMTAHYTVTR